MTIKVAIKSPRPGWKIQPVLAAPRWGGERERERNSGYNTGRRDTVRDITRNWNSITLLRKRNDIISELLLPRCPLLRYTRYPCIKPTAPVIPVRLIEVNF